MLDCTQIAEIGDCQTERKVLCMNMEKLDVLSQEIKKLSDSIEQYERELSEILKDGVNNEELKKANDVNATLAVAAGKFEQVTKEMRRLAAIHSWASHLNWRTSISHRPLSGQPGA